MERPAKSQILLVRGEKITSKICDFALRKPILYGAWRLHSHMRQRYLQPKLKISKSMDYHEIVQQNSELG